MLAHERYVTDKQRDLRLAAARIEQRVADHITVLRAIKGALAANGTILQRDRFTAFLKAMPDWAGVQGYGFALAIGASETAAAVDVGRRSYPGFPAPWPPTDQSLRTPIVLLEPNNVRNAAALGFDMFGEAVRREAMQRARDTRTVAISRPVQLVQEIDEQKQIGALVYLPAFRDEGIWIPGAESGSDLVGFVYAPLRIGDLAATVLGEEPAIKHAITIYFETASPAMVMYARGKPGGLEITVPITVADRTWLVRIAEGQGHSLLNSPAFPLTLFGVLISTLIGFVARAYLANLTAERKLAQAIHDKNDSYAVLLGEMQHRIKNSIARKLALFRLSVRETTDRTALIQSFESRMLALAKAQDLMLASPDRALGLDELVEQEIGSWRRGNDKITCDGPKVMLDGHQVQGLSLILHEIVTNSLKYGALSAAGAVSVVWMVDADQSPPLLRLIWREAVPASAADSTRTGFGSRLLKLVAEGHLSGSIERSFKDGYLTISLSCPIHGQGHDPA